MMHGQKNIKLFTSILKVHVSLGCNS